MILRRLPSLPSWSTGLRELDVARREMERLFDSLTDFTGPRTAGVFPAINVSEDTESVYVRAELPGLDPKLYYSIREVADYTGVKAHVLRYRLFVYDGTITPETAEPDAASGPPRHASVVPWLVGFARARVRACTRGRPSGRAARRRRSRRGAADRRRQGVVLRVAQRRLHLGDDRPRRAVVQARCTQPTQGAQAMALGRHALAKGSRRHWTGRSYTPRWLLFGLESWCHPR